MSHFMTVTIVIAVFIGIILSAMMFGVMLLAKDRLRPFARSSYIFLGTCGGVAYSILAIVWILAAVVSAVASELDSAIGALVCAVVGGVLGGHLLRSAYRRLTTPNRQNEAARTTWLAALNSVSAELSFADEAKSSLLCRAVEELFIPDNISPETWLKNWVAFHNANLVAMGIGQFPNPTPSARVLIEKWWVLPPKREWFLAAYPDVDLWWDMAQKEAIRAKHKGEGDSMESLERKVFGAFLDDTELEKADEVTVNLLWSRILVDYYRSNVNHRLECEL